jgi:hypothetical protein
MTPSRAGATAPAKAKTGQRKAGPRPRPAARTRPRAGTRAAPRRSAPRARRLSGPSSRALPELRPLPALGTIGIGAIRVGRSLQNSPLLDRLLRGRGWIGLLAVLLMGLVALNVSLLKLNAEAGRDADTAKSLRIRNDRLRARVARLASGERLEAVGAKLGLAMPEPGRIRYLSVRSSDARHAAKTIRSAQRSAPVETPPAPAPAPTAAAPEAPAAGSDPAAAQAAPTPGTSTPAPAAPTAPQSQPPAAAAAPATGGEAPVAAAPAQQPQG